MVSFITQRRKSMRLKDDQVLRLATKIMDDLSAKEVISLKKDRGAVLAAIREAITADIKQEESLEREAERLLEEAVRATGGNGIDRHKMLRMIKEKLARDKKIVL